MQKIKFPAGNNTLTLLSPRYLPQAPNGHYTLLELSGGHLQSQCNKIRGHRQPRKSPCPLREVSSQLSQLCRPAGLKCVSHQLQSPECQQPAVGNALQPPHICWAPVLPSRCVTPFRDTSQRDQLNYIPLPGPLLGKRRFLYSLGHVTLLVPGPSINIQLVWSPKRTVHSILIAN